MFRRLVLGIAASLVLASAPAAAQARELTVFAASDLTFALRELAPKFEQAQRVKVTLVFGSTGNLARQIDNGAPADVFFAANETFLDDLVKRAVVAAGTRTVYAQGRIVLATAKTFGPALTDLRSLLDERVRHVAIANPVHAPYGKAAEEALRRADIWDAVKPKLVYGESIRQALQFIESGAAEAGIVALSVASVPSVTFTMIDANLHAPLIQVAGVVARSASPDLGRAFLRFVNGPEGRAVMKRRGFILPGEL
ncbi:MAG TPA: molybdate ABC transporter substrate-binding protein [Methylomirabilota bacterium]|jgi:molybdate transport system substrate-binding protein|nr:molybdate ABC transporter substrate-binding protein [Methylomirabilota bacterium]HEV8615871.1 molybdate ABC transporter substrate-binding protein [Methylomirabilota bacterium]